LTAQVKQVSGHHQRMPLMNAREKMGQVAVHFHSNPPNRRELRIIAVTAASAADFRRRMTKSE